MYLGTHEKYKNRLVKLKQKEEKNISTSLLFCTFLQIKIFKKYFKKVLTSVNKYSKIKCVPHKVRN